MSRCRGVHESTSLRTGGGSDAGSLDANDAGSLDANDAFAQGVEVVFALAEADEDVGGGGGAHLDGAGGHARAHPTVYAAAGEDMLEVAARAGVALRLGCCTGSCGICEVEVTTCPTAARPLGEVADGGMCCSGGAFVMRACVGRVPEDCARVVVRDLTYDEVWGMDRDWPPP